MGFVYLDTETTSFNPGQICELTYIVEDMGNVTKANNLFFTVKEMDSGAEQVHGFSLEFLKEASDGREFKDYANELLPILSNNIMIAHNLPFDEKFISMEFWRCGISFKPQGRLDTMVYFKNILQIPAKSKRYGPFKNPKLSEVVEYFNIDMNKVAELAQSLFKCTSKESYHDSRIDTTAMFVAVNIQREKLHGGFEWQNRFCRG